jgi:hypothetical protein
LPKKLHPRSAVAQRTAGITLDHAAPLYDWLAPLMTRRHQSKNIFHTVLPAQTRSLCAPPGNPIRVDHPVPPNLE